MSGFFIQKLSALTKQTFFITHPIHINLHVHEFHVKYLHENCRLFISNQLELQVKMKSFAPHV